MINERQREILKLIIEEYIKTAKPVSSKALMDTLNCSSATIRSEMNYLEEIGLLEKTHISSGRVPSEEGYRYYVNNIMVPKELNGDDILKLQTIFKNNSLVLSDAIVKSLEIVSQLTNCTLIALGESSKQNKVSKVEVIPVNENNVVAIIVTDKGHVENRNVYIEEKISPLEIKQTVDLINKYVVGTPLDEVNAKLEFEVKPVIGENVNYQRKLFDAFCNFVNDVTHDSSYKVTGASNILKQPEFDDTSKIRDILSKFEDKEFIKRIKADNNEVSVYIGSETEFDDNVSIIKTKYSIDGEEGTIALIGPTRMEYDKVTTLLNYIKEEIEHIDNKQ